MHGAGLGLAWNRYGLSCIYIFNPVSMEWRESGNLPNIGLVSYPRLLLWANNVILVEEDSSRIWVRDEEHEEWLLSDVSIGFFVSSSENLALVSDSWRKGCL